VGESVSLDWTAGWVNENAIVAVYCPGNLTIIGDLLNLNANSGPLLLLGGDLNVNNLVCAGSRVMIQGSVNANGVVIGDYNDGFCRIGDDLNATLLILLDHDVSVEGRTNCPVADWNEDTLSLLAPEVFVDDEVNIQAVLSRQHAGLPILCDEPPSSPDGLAIARERIAKEAEEKTGFLNLWGLQLTELPEELFRLKHLQRLNLGDWIDDGAWQCATSERNSIGNDDLARLAGLNALQWLSLINCVLSDLAPLAGLPNLQTLDCSRTQVSDLAPVAGLSNLQTLNCSCTQVGDLAPLSGLSNLQYLDCSHTQVSDLAPVSRLSNLQTLDCSSTQVSDLAPLAGLSSNLQTLYCFYTQVSDLAPLAGLSNLQALYCSGTQLSDLAPLAGLSNLQTLYCADMQVSDLAPVSGLSNLQKLKCSYTQVSDLTPLAGLSNLQELDCSYTRVSDLAPLAGLSNLQELSCSYTRVSDLAPLAGLSNLQTLWASGTPVDDLAFQITMNYVQVRDLARSRDVKS
jgi:Leucine-rich repeat (LRR) protein